MRVSTPLDHAYLMNVCPATGLPERVGCAGRVGIGRGIQKSRFRRILGEPSAREVGEQIAGSRMYAPMIS